MRRLTTREKRLVKVLEALFDNAISNAETFGVHGNILNYKTYRGKAIGLSTAISAITDDKYLERLEEITKEE